MMQFLYEESIGKRLELKKRTSSATFHSKKVKALLTSRQISDETIMCKMEKEAELPPTVSSRIINYHRKEKSNVEFSNEEINVKKCKKKALLEIIKPMKYEKSNEENLLLKNCDKSKLIYWSKDLHLSGREKYVLISADLLMDQDNFWDKVSTDNGHLNGNLASVNYQSATLTRNRNINMALPPKNGLSTNNVGSSGLSNLSKRNPLMNWSKINLLVREWKSLHSKVDSDGRRLVVLWVIRRQSSYGHLMEFVQTYQLPLHGIFYVKRKRSNQFFDLGLIVKEIYQKFFESIITPSTKVEKDSPKTLKSIERNTDLRRSKSKENEKFTIINKKQSTELSIEQNSHNTLNSVHSATYKFIKSTKEEPQMQEQEEENDENCQEKINVESCKEFELSKNIVVNKKKSLMSIIMDDERVRKGVRKIPSLLVGGMKRPETVKILESVEKIEIYEKESCKNVIKRYTSPLIANDDIDTLEIEELEEDLLAQIDEKEQEERDEGLCNKRRFMRPEIFVFEGVKCNMKDSLVARSYEGRLPLMFSYHDRRYFEVKEKLEQEGIEIVEDSKSEGKHVKMFYLKYEMVREGMLEKVNSVMKEITSKARSYNDLHQYSNNVLCEVASELPQYVDSTVASIMSEFSTYMKNRPSQQLESEQPTEEEEPIFSEEQEEQLVERTEKQLEEIKKKMISDVIAMKGRNYTFENGESVYYYVGGMFKRNYNLIYNEYYAKYEAEMKATIKGQIIKSVKNSPVNIKHENNEQHSNNESNAPFELNTIPSPKLSPIQFFNLSNNPTIY